MTYRDLHAIYCTVKKVNLRTMNPVIVLPDFTLRYHRRSSAANGFNQYIDNRYSVEFFSHPKNCSEKRLLRDN